MSLLLFPEPNDKELPHGNPLPHGSGHGQRNGILLPQTSTLTFKEPRNTSGWNQPPNVSENARDIL